MFQGSYGLCPPGAARAGLQGCMGLGEISLPNIGLESLAATIKQLPNADLETLILGLPEDVVRRICKTGAVDEAKSYIPWAIGGAVVLGLFFVMK